jgi:hypothetical protein
MTSFLQSCNPPSEGEKATARVQSIAQCHSRLVECVLGDLRLRLPLSELTVVAEGTDHDKVEIIIERPRLLQGGRNPEAGRIFLPLPTSKSAEEVLNQVRRVLHAAPRIVSSFSALEAPTRTDLGTRTAIGEEAVTVILALVNPIDLTLDDSKSTKTKSDEVNVIYQKARLLE